MKRLFVLMLATVFLLTTVCFATEAEALDGGAIYIETQSCPIEFVEYAEENVARFVLAMDENQLIDYDQLKLGQPFSYGLSTTNFYTFPVFEGNDVIYTFRVACGSDGELHGTMSQFLVDELNAYIGATTRAEPVRFEMIGNELVAIQGTETETVFCFPIAADEDANVSIALSSASADLNTINIADVGDVTMNIVPARATSSYIFLDFPGDAPQDGNNWCCAFVIAAIVNTQTGLAWDAEDVMTYCYGSADPDEALYMSYAAAFARDMGLTHTAYIRSTLSNSDLMDQIDDDCPVALNLRRSSGSGSHPTHAVALRGYSTIYDTWSIWNPWDTGYSSFDIGGEYIHPDATGPYVYDGGTIYNCY